MRAWDTVITIALGLLLALFLFPALYYILSGWLILFGLSGLLWIRSLWPAASWVEPLATLPAFVSVAAFWVALVLQTRRFVGLAEGSETSMRIGEWSVPLSCTVFGFASFVAWRVHAVVFNLALAVASIDPFGIPLLDRLYAWQLFMVTTVLALVIALPNYGHLAVAGMKGLIHSISYRWSTWRDHRLLGKAHERRDVGVEPRRRETGKSFKMPSDILPVVPTDSSPSVSPMSYPTASFPSEYWRPSSGQLPGVTSGMRQPMMPDSQVECIVCGRNLSAAAQMLRCPYCSARAHQRHFLKWLKDNDRCPRCRAPLTPYDLTEG